MGKTKKEHYVPQCYLRNFVIPGTDEKINVFDKSLEQVRLKQNILDNACLRLHLMYADIPSVVEWQLQE